MQSAVTAILCCLAIATSALAASPEAEKQFVDTYRKAFEAKDSKTLVALLYTKGADPQALAFYKMMMGAEGGKVSSIQLLPLTPEDKAKSESGKSPDGRKMTLVLPATRKLVVKTETKDKNGSSTSSSEIFVGESDGKLYVLVPAAAK
jgi:hypothetical protein